MFVYYCFIKPLSLLPLPVLHVLSRILYLVVYKTFGYRKDVVRKNLQNSFPNKTENEIREIEKNFYKHLMDIMLESIKNFSVSNRAIKKRVVIKNPEVIQEQINRGKNVIATCGHYNNWETGALSVPFYIQGGVYAIYKPLKNKFINKKTKASRSKTGITFIDNKEVKSTFKKNRKKGCVIFFLTDQSPSNPKKAYWTNFLNQRTAVLFGAEKYALEYNCVVAYTEITKIKRGYYEGQFKIIEENPHQTNHGEITENHTRHLEETIIKEPAYWLWSHKRWKHTEK